MPPCAHQYFRFAVRVTTVIRGSFVDTWATHRILSLVSKSIAKKTQKKNLPSADYVSPSVNKTTSANYTDNDSDSFASNTRRCPYLKQIIVNVGPNRPSPENIPMDFCESHLIEKVEGKSFSRSS